jgi:hypothetical protein
VVQPGSGRTAGRAVWPESGAVALSHVGTARGRGEAAVGPMWR